MALTEKKIQVYSSFSTLLIRVLYSIIFLVAFVVILVFLLIFCFAGKGPEITIPLGAIDAVLCGTLYPTVKWLFPLDKK